MPFFEILHVKEPPYSLEVGLVEAVEIAVLEDKSDPDDIGQSKRAEKVEPDIGGVS